MQFRIPLIVLLILARCSVMDPPPPEEPSREAPSPIEAHWPAVWMFSAEELEEIGYKGNVPKDDDFFYLGSADDYIHRWNCTAARGYTVPVSFIRDYGIKPCERCCSDLVVGLNPGWSEYESDFIAGLDPPCTSYEREYISSREPEDPEPPKSPVMGIWDVDPAKLPEVNYRGNLPDNDDVFYANNRGGARYAHRWNCPRIKSSAIAMSLEVTADLRYEPCPICCSDLRLISNDELRLDPISISDVGGEQ